MSRKNAKNIKAYNEKLHKAQDKEKAKRTTRNEQLKAIIKKFNQNNDTK